MRMMGKALLEEIGVEYGFVDQASDSMVLGIESLSHGGNPLQYPGFISIHSNGDSIPKETASLPYVPTEKSYRDINVKYYTQKGGVVGFQTKYGCDLGCIYCNYPVIEGTEVVCYSPQNIVDTIKTVVKTNALHFFEFADSTFNYPLDHAKQICHLLQGKKLGAGWSAFMSPRFFDEEFGALCKYSGCAGIELGIDSASNTMLKNLHKGFTTEDIEHSCEVAQKYNIPICFNLLLGGCGENQDTLNETFTFLKQYPNCAVSAYSALRVYPNTPLERIARAENRVTGSLLYPQFYISLEIEETLNEILEAHREKHPEWMLRGITKPPSAMLIERFVRDRNSPLWGEKNNGFLSRRTNDSDMRS